MASGGSTADAGAWFWLITHIATIVNKIVDFEFLHNDAVKILAILFGYEIHGSRPHRWL